MTCTKALLSSKDLSVLLFFIFRHIAFLHSQSALTIKNRFIFHILIMLVHVSNAVQRKRKRISFLSFLELTTKNRFILHILIMLVHVSNAVQRKRKRISFLSFLELTFVSFVFCPGYQRCCGAVVWSSEFEAKTVRSDLVPYPVVPHHLGVMTRVADSISCVLFLRSQRLALKSATSPSPSA